MSIPIRKPSDDNETVNEAMQSTDDVYVFQHKSLFGKFGRSVFFGFEPRTQNIKGVGIIIYPGTLVDATAYAPLAKRLAYDGYHAVIATPPLSLSSVGDLLGSDYADKIIDFGWKDEIKTWVISGHSQGGAIACAYAASNQGSNLKGVILLASYPGDGRFFNGNLSKTDYEVMSIYGSLDGIALYQDVVIEGAKLLPPKTKFVEIDGGNHSQFSYAEGIQESGDKVDGVPTITVEAQQDIIARNVLEFLSQF